MQLTPAGKFFTSVSKALYGCLSFLTNFSLKHQSQILHTHHHISFLELVEWNDWISVEWNIGITLPVFKQCKKYSDIYSILVWLKTCCIIRFHCTDFSYVRVCPINVCELFWFSMNLWHKYELGYVSWYWKTSVICSPFVHWRVYKLL